VSPLVASVLFIGRRRSATFTLYPPAGCGSSGLYDAYDYAISGSGFIFSDTAVLFLVFIDVLLFKML
jgi:hypothetical protein